MRQSLRLNSRPYPILGVFASWREIFLSTLASWRATLDGQLAVGGE
jgi:hypothetical protein